MPKINLQGFPMYSILPTIRLTLKQLRNKIMAKAKAPVVRTHADKVADREAGIETSGNAKTHGAALQGKPVETTPFKTGRGSDK